MNKWVQWGLISVPLVGGGCYGTKYVLETYKSLTTLFTLFKKNIIELSPPSYPKITWSSITQKEEEELNGQFHYHPNRMLLLNNLQKNIDVSNEVETHSKLSLLISMLRHMLMTTIATEKLANHQPFMTSIDAKYQKFYEASNPIPKHIDIIKGDETTKKKIRSTTYDKTKTLKHKTINTLRKIITKDFAKRLFHFSLLSRIQEKAQNTPITERNKNLLFKPTEFLQQIKDIADLSMEKMNDKFYEMLAAEMLKNLKKTAKFTETNSTSKVVSEFPNLNYFVFDFLNQNQEYLEKLYEPTNSNQSKFSGSVTEKHQFILRWFYNHNNNSAETNKDQMNKITIRNLFRFDFESLYIVMSNDQNNLRYLYEYENWKNQVLCQSNSDFDISSIPDLKTKVCKIDCTMDPATNNCSAPAT